MKRFKSASEIRSACIGYGPTCNMGKLHFSYMIEAGIKPVAVCDVNQEALETAKKDFPDIDVYSSADEMLSREDINLVTVILPHNLHSEFVIKCLNAGKNTVVEKPMAITTKECDKMMAAAKKNKCLLSVFHNRHWTLLS